MPHPLFVSFEGIDGCGKSTQSRLLAQNLNAENYPTILTREPGGSPGAEEIRSLLLTGATDRWSPETEILLFTAARRDHLEKTVTPALSAGKTVITDRFVDSTRVYQGATRGDLRSIVDDLHERIISTLPDLTFILDMDPSTALTRGLARNSGEDRFEDFGLEFQIKLRDGFREIARENPHRCHLIDASRSTEEIAKSIFEIAKAHL